MEAQCDDGKDANERESVHLQLGYVGVDEDLEGKELLHGPPLQTS